MTALVACLGLLPAALSTGIGSDSQKPFAIVIVAGLISRLFLGRIVSPCCTRYSPAKETCCKSDPQPSTHAHREHKTVHRHSAPMLSVCGSSRRASTTGTRKPPTSSIARSATSAMPRFRTQLRYASPPRISRSRDSRHCVGAAFDRSSVLAKHSPRASRLAVTCNPTTECLRS